MLKKIHDHFNSDQLQIYPFEFFHEKLKKQNSWEQLSTIISIE